MTFKPDFKRAERTAYQLLKIGNVQKLPVKVKRLAKNFPNLKIKTYTWFAKKRGFSLDEVIAYTDSVEGCCFYDPPMDEYMILYNDTIENTGRIRWTIAHELGHFMLKHNEITNKTIFARSSLSKREYHVFEQEANCFARNLLAPLPVITNLGRDLTTVDISNICGISFEAAENVIKFMLQGRQMGIVGYPLSSTFRNFSNFIYEINNTYICINCSHKFITNSPKYCPKCRSKRISKPFTLVGDDEMKYSGYELDEIGRAKICPRCENENIQGFYCQVCGTYLINKCTGISGNNGYPYNGPWHEIQGCGKFLSGDARFCTECGSSSTFYEQGLLIDWEKEKEAKESESFSNSDRPQLQVVNFDTNDDLPF